MPLPRLLPLARISTVPKFETMEGAGSSHKSHTLNFRCQHNRFSLSFQFSGLLFREGHDPGPETLFFQWAYQVSQE